MTLKGSTRKQLICSELVVKKSLVISLFTTRIYRGGNDTFNTSNSSSENDIYKTGQGSNVV